jgi:hypothetical protein
VPAVAEPFTEDELQGIADRANELAHDQEADASLRTGLQLLAEAAANLVPKVATASSPGDLPS